MPCNFSNYNSFYAAPSKKLENIILEMNRKLDEIEKEFSDLTKKENSTRGKRKWVCCSSDVINNRV